MANASNWLNSSLLSNESTRLGVSDLKNASDDKLDISEAAVWPISSISSNTPELSNVSDWFNTSDFVDDFMMEPYDRFPGYSEHSIYATIKYVTDFVMVCGVCPLGVIGNLVTIVILTRERNRHSSFSVFLSFLAASDITILLSGSFPNILAKPLKIPHSTVFDCTVVFYFNQTSFEMSAWITALVSIERAVSVVFPLHVKLIFRPRQAAMSVMALCVFFLSINLYIPLGYYFDMDFGMCVAKPFLEQNYRWISTIEIIISCALPYLTIFICSIIIGYHMMCSRRQRITQKTNHQLLVTLLAVNIVFLLCMLPFSIYHLLNPTIDDDITVLPKEEQLFVWDILFIVMELNPALNFFIYFLSGSRFRNDFISMFGCCRKSKPRKNVPVNVDTQRQNVLTKTVTHSVSRSR